MSLETIYCDCGIPSLIKTNESLLCGKCGIIIDKIYETEKLHKEISHFSSPIIGVIHPSINKTISELSKLVEIKTDTRLYIIERANYLSKTVNYIEATKYAFQEFFPDIDLEMNKKYMKKLNRGKNNYEHIQAKSASNHSNNYSNRYLFNQIIKVKNLIKINRKKGKTIDETLSKIKFPRRKYFLYKNMDFINKKQKNRDKKITLEISEFIKNNCKLTLKELKHEILYRFFVDLHFTTIHYHKRKLRNETKFKHAEFSPR